MKETSQQYLRACLVFSLLVFAAACSKSGGKLGNDYGIAYLPLRDGQKFVYQRECDGRVEPIVMELSFVQGDLETPEFRVDASGMGDRFLRRQGNAIVCLMERPPARLRELAQGELYLSTWLLDGATPGTFWEDEDTGLRTAVAGFESVTTPAGTFESCMKVTIEATEILWEVTEERIRRDQLSPEQEDAICEDLSQICIRWFARGVGLVKEEHGACRMELISYR
ncbi:MAG: hypothetical protein V1784_00710 [bacterium]